MLHHQRNLVNLIRLSLAVNNDTLNSFVPESLPRS